MQKIKFDKSKPIFSFESMIGANGKANFRGAKPILAGLEVTQSHVVPP
jgi:hypothetical protein